MSPSRGPKIRSVTAAVPSRRARPPPMTPGEAGFDPIRTRSKVPTRVPLFFLRVSLRNMLSYKTAMPGIGCPEHRAAGPASYNNRKLRPITNPEYRSTTKQ